MLSLPFTIREFRPMYSGNFVFSQVMAHLPMHTFRRCVQRYHGHQMSQMGSGHPNYLFPFSLRAAYSGYSPLNPAFCLQKQGFKISISLSTIQPHQPALPSGRRYKEDALPTVRWRPESSGRQNLRLLNGNGKPRV